MRHLRAGRAPIVRWEIARGGEERHVLYAQMTPVHDDSHAVTGYVVSTTDISASTRARDAATAAALTLARTTELERVFQETALELRQTLRPDLIVIAVIDESSSPRVVYDAGADAGSETDGLDKLDPESGSRMVFRTVEVRYWSRVINPSGDGRTSRGPAL